MSSHDRDGVARRSTAVPTFHVPSCPAPGRVNRSAALPPRSATTSVTDETGPDPTAGLLRDANGVASTAAARIDALSTGGGSGLPAGLRGRFESSLGVDLGDVRIHSDGDSARAADALGARAFALGDDVRFAAGQYRPDDPFGQHLIAHEVAHTVQQRGAAPAPQSKLEVSTPTDAAELEADRAADAMVVGAPVSLAAGRGGAIERTIHRDAKPSGAKPPAANPSAADTGSLGYDPDQKDALDKATLETLGKESWKALKKTPAGAAALEAVGSKMETLVKGTLSTNGSAVLASGVLAGFVSVILTRMAQALKEKELPAEISLVLNALDIEELTAVGLPEFGLKLEYTGPLAAKGPTETNVALTISYTPGGGPKKEDDGKAALAKETAALVKTIRLYSGGGATKDDLKKAWSKLPSESTYSDDDPLHPKAPPPKGPPGPPGPIANAPSTPTLFGTLAGFAAGSATVVVADAAQLRSMAVEINGLATAQHSITIIVYGHVAAGEKAELATARAEAAAGILRGTLDPTIKSTANQTKGDGGRKVEVMLMKLASVPHTELALPKHKSTS